MGILKKILLVLVLLIAIVIGVGFVLPDTAHVERSVTVDARPATVFTVLNGFTQFNKWSPWADIDPNATTTIEGPRAGVGARMSWAGNKQVGRGSQEIVESTPYSKIRIALEFADWDSENWATYDIAPAGEGSKVTWSFDTAFQGSIMGRYFGLMMDKMLGADYDKGLARLKILVEGMPEADFANAKLEVVDTKAAPVACASGTTQFEQAPAALGEAFGKVNGFMAANAIKQVDAPVAVTRKFDDASKTWDFDACIPVDRTDVVVAAGGEVKFAQTYEGKAIKIVHNGPYSAMEPTYGALTAYKVAAGYEDNGLPWEHYVTDPATTADTDLVTHVYWPVK